jgi:hypothetical protein
VVAAAVAAAATAVVAAAAAIAGKRSAFANAHSPTPRNQHATRAAQRRRVVVPA